MPAAIVIVIDAPAVVPPGPIALTVNVPEVLVGVPAKTAPVRVMPGGRLPAVTAKLVVLDATKVYPAYAVPTVPVVGGESAEKTGAGGLILFVISVADKAAVDKPFTLSVTNPAVSATSITSLYAATGVKVIFTPPDISATVLIVLPPPLVPLNVTLAVVPVSVYASLVVTGTKMVPGVELAIDGVPNVGAVVLTDPTTFTIAVGVP